MRMAVSGDFRDSLAAVIALFILFNIVGFFGNMLVFYIYAFRNQRTCFRTLVLALCFVDFISCCTTVPMEIVSTWYWLHSPSTALCKSKNFFVQFSATSAIYMLFVTAVYKYRKFCRPFSKKMTQQMIVIFCLVGIVISVIFAIPAPILWDINNHTITWENTSENVFICEVNHIYHRTVYPTVYRIMLSIYDIFLLITVILYVFVARVIIAHFPRMKRRPDVANDRLSLSSTIHGMALTRTCKNTERLENNETEAARNQRETSPKEADENVAQATSQPDTHSSARTRTPLPRNQIRFVLIMVIIVGTFSVTFTMGLSFSYVFALRSYSDFSSNSERVIMFACYRLYFINYAMNPVVYFTLDRRFRTEVFKLLALLGQISHSFVRDA